MMDADGVNFVNLSVCIALQLSFFAYINQLVVAARFFLISIPIARRRAHTKYKREDAATLLTRPMFGFDITS